MRERWRVHLGGCDTGTVATDVATGDSYETSVTPCESGETLEILGHRNDNEAVVGSTRVS